VVAALIDELAGGSTTDTALVAVAATTEGYAEPLSKASMAIRDGADPTVALASFPDLSALALAIRTAQQTGTPLAGVLRGVLADASADQLASRAVATALAGPRTSAALLALLPMIGLAMGWAMGADPIRVLLHTAAGQIALAAGILLDTAGLTWTVAMTRRATT
jgi:tight adherence protein B